MKITKTEKAEIVMAALFKDTKVTADWTTWKQKSKKLARQPKDFVNNMYQQAIRILDPRSVNN